MKNNRKGMIQFVVVGIAILVILAFWVYSQSTSKYIDCCNQATHQTSNNMVGMADPSSVFCRCIGGTTTIREESAGQRGMCKIGLSEVDAWKLFYEKCPNQY